MPDALNGKVAVITGASSGVGEAAARAFARAGAKVVLAARSRGKIGFGDAKALVGDTLACAGQLMFAVE